MSGIVCAHKTEMSLENSIICSYHSLFDSPVWICGAVGPEAGGPELQVPVWWVVSGWTSSVPHSGDQEPAVERQSQRHTPHFFTSQIHPALSTLCSARAKPPTAWNTAAKPIFKDMLEDRFSFILRNITPDLQPKCCILFIHAFTFLSSVGKRVLVQDHLAADLISCVIFQRTLMLLQPQTKGMWSYQSKNHG